MAFVPAVQGRRRPWTSASSAVDWSRGSTMGRPRRTSPGVSAWASPSNGGSSDRRPRSPRVIREEETMAKENNDWNFGPTTNGAGTKWTRDPVPQGRGCRGGDCVTIGTVLRQDRRWRTRLISRMWSRSLTWWSWCSERAKATLNLTNKRPDRFDDAM